MINLASRLGLAPAQGHTGFDRVVVGEGVSMEASYFAHYLHHKYFAGRLFLMAWCRSTNGSARSTTARRKPMKR